MKPKFTVKLNRHKRCVICGVLTTQAVRISMIVFNVPERTRTPMCDPCLIQIRETK